MSNPLFSGLRVLDLSRLLPGPFCTLQLAQLGADVLKIEHPGGGDEARELAPALFELVNRGKRSAALDLRQADDRARFLELARDADVVVESFRAGVMDRLGCGAAVLRAANPRLVYAALSGYGHSGVWRHRAGHDLNFSALSGVIEQIGARGGAPVIPNLPIADLAGGGLTAALAIAAAVYGARSSGRGAFLDASIFDGTLALQCVALSQLNTTGKTPKRGADTLSGALPNYRLYRCRDGRYLAVAALEGKFFRHVLEGVLAKLPTERHRELSPVLSRALLHWAAQHPRSRLLHYGLSAAFRLCSSGDWLDHFADYDACVSPVLRLDEALHLDIVHQRERVVAHNGRWHLRFPVQFTDAALRESCPAPTLGGDQPVWLDEPPIRASPQQRSPKRNRASRPSKSSPR